MRRPRIPWPLAALLVVAAVQALAWAILTPPFQGPDEAEHAAYAQHLAETGEGVKRTVQGPGYSTEIETALLQLNLAALRSNAAARPALSDLDLERWERYQRTMPDEHRENGVGPNAQAQNPPLYYALQVVPYTLASGGDLFTRVLAMRLLNVLLFVAIVALAWFLAAELFTTRQWPRVVAAGAVALQPKLASLGGSISPDVLLTLVWTAFALVAVRTLKHGPTVRRAALLGLLTAASVLTQGRGLAILPPALIVLVLVLLRHRPPRATALKLAGIGGGIALAGLVIAALWSASSSGGGAFGGEVTQSGGNPTLIGFISYVWQFYFPRLGFLDPRIGPEYGWRQMYIETFFSSLASLEVVFRPRTFDYLQNAVFVGLMVFYLQLVVFRRKLLAQWPVVLLLASIPLSLLAVLHVSAYRDLLINPSQPLITGRYLVPAIALFGVTLAFVCAHLPRRLGPFAGAAVLATGVALSLGSFGVALERFYA